MKFVKRLSVGLGSMVVIASFFTLVAPKAARAMAQQFVQLVDTTSNPAIVSNMNDPGRIPYQSSLVTTAQNCSAGNECLFSFPAVPAGHRLVIEHVSGFLEAAPGAVPALVALNLSNSHTFTNTTIFTLTSQNNVGSVVAFDQPVLVYVDEGLAPNLTFALSSAPSAGAVQSAFLSGYLLDCTAAPCSPIAK